MPPNVKEDFTKKVFGHPLVMDETQQPSVHPHAMTREECSHGRLIALSDLFDQRFVGRTVACRCLCRRCGDPRVTDVSRRHGRHPLCTKNTLGCTAEVTIVTEITTA